MEKRKKGEKTPLFPREENKRRDSFEEETIRRRKRIGCVNSVSRKGPLAIVPRGTNRAASDCTLPREFQR